MLGVFPGSDAFGKELLQLPSEMWLYSPAKTGQEKESPCSVVIDTTALMMQAERMTGWQVVPLPLGGLEGPVAWITGPDLSW